MPAYTDQGFVVNGGERFEAFFTSVNRPNLGVVADLGNILFVGETAESFVGRFAGQIRHVHVKDYLFKPGCAQDPGEGWYTTRAGDYLRGTIVGHGVVPFAQILRILRGAGYDGYYSAEFDGPEPPLFAVEAGMRNLRRYDGETRRV